MSSELANAFSQDYHEKYAEVVDSWADTAVGEKVTDDMVSKWGADLYDALADDVISALTNKNALALWSGRKVILPSKETLKRFSQIAAKYSLQHATRDLLKRLIRSADWDKENPPDTVIAAIRPMRPSELAARSPQTTAQIFDMAKDRFTAVLSRYLTRNSQFTGRRRWNTVGKNSRHAALDGEIRGPDEFFIYKGEEVAAPRPVGGAPASWSNCSCSLSYERKNGSWVL